MSASPEVQPPSRAGNYRALVSAIVEFIGPRMIPTFALVGLAAILEAVGLVLLLPVAETVFAQSEGQTGVTAAVAGGLASIGVEAVLGQLAVMGSGFVVLVLLRAYVLRIRDIRLMELSQGFVDHERRKFFVLLAEADWPVIKRYRKANLLNSLTTNIGRLATAMHFLTRGLVALALGIAALAAGFIVSWTLGFLLLGMTAVGVAFALVWTKRSRRSGNLLNRANYGVVSETIRFFDGLKAAKAARAETELEERFAASIAETRAINVAFAAQQASLRNAIQVTAALVALGVLIAGYGFLDLGGGELLVMAAIVLRLSPNLLSTLSGLQSVAHALPAFAAIRDLEEKLAREHENLHQRTGQAEPKAIGDSPPAGLFIRRASVQVTDEPDAVVTLVETDTLAIAPGSVVHVSGPSGAGKSTFAELVAGLYLPATGLVQHDSLTLGRETRGQWQEGVAFVPQEPFLFDGTVRENLLWPNWQADDAATWQALEMAQADVIVRDLPGGLDADLLDGGARLSGGERQRLCLARALLIPARLLILDEGTSAMDPILERAVLSRLRERQSDTIVLNVTHSLNAIDLADMHLEVSNGRVRLAQ